MLSFKSKYSTIEEILNDHRYCVWLLHTKWFKDKPEFDLVKKSFKDI